METYLFLLGFPNSLHFLRCHYAYLYCISAAYNFPKQQEQQDKIGMWWNFYNNFIISQSHCIT